MKRTYGNLNINTANYVYVINGNGNNVNTRIGEGASRDGTDSRLVKAVRDLYASPEHLLNSQQQWFAVYRVCAAYLGYPVKYTDFARRMEDIRVNADCEGLPPCKADSIRQAGKVMPQLCNTRPSAWGRFSGLGKAYELQWNVARSLMERMGITADDED